MGLFGSSKNSKIPLERRARDLEITLGVPSKEDYEYSNGYEIRNIKSIGETVDWH